MNETFWGLTSVQFLLVFGSITFVAAFVAGLIYEARIDNRDRRDMQSAAQREADELSYEHFKREWDGFNYGGDDEI